MKPDLLMTGKLQAHGGRMSERQLYHLAENVIVEPLIDRWIAWPHNFSPVLYGLHLLNYQKEVLTSYLKNPSFHVKSCRNPKLLGGPFVDVPQERMKEINRLLEDIEQNHMDLLKLGRDLIDFQNKLIQAATGQCIEIFYNHIPESLRGLVELGYDYHNHPIVRCIESLFYESSYYKKASQSFRLSSLIHDDARPYYMSTPRLMDANDIEWHIPFDSSKVDELFKLDIQPQPLNTIRDLLSLSVTDESRLLQFLSVNQPVFAKPWNGAGARLRYFGHASVLFEANGVSILTDPFISVSPQQSEVERFTFRDLPERIDYVLITHGHHDHFVFESLLRLRHRIGTVVVPRSSGIFYGDISLKQLAHRLGFSNVQELDALDSLSFLGVKITAIPFLGEHCDLLHAKSGYVIGFGGEQILFAADSCCLDQHLYEHVTNILGSISTVFIGMECIGAPLSWVYSPLLPTKPERTHDQSRRSHANNAQSALALLRTVRAQRVYVYALGREPWLKYFMALIPADDDPYMQEINQLIAEVSANGLMQAQMLYGKKDLYLSINKDN